MKLFLVAVGPPSLNLSLFLIHPSGWEDQRASDKRWGSGDRGDCSGTEDSRRSRSIAAATGFGKRIIWQGRTVYILFHLSLWITNIAFFSKGTEARIRCLLYGELTELPSLKKKVLPFICILWETHPDKYCENRTINVIVLFPGKKKLMKWTV